MFTLGGYWPERFYVALPLKKELGLVVVVVLLAVSVRTEGRRPPFHLGSASPN